MPPTIDVLVPVCIALLIEHFNELITAKPDRIDNLIVIVAIFIRDLHERDELVVVIDGWKPIFRGRAKLGNCANGVSVAYIVPFDSAKSLLFRCRCE